MAATSLALLVASLGVVYNFEPVGDGSDSYDYVVRVEPELLDSLAAGNPMPIESHVPDRVRSIRSVRVVLGGRDDQQPRGPVEHTSHKQVSGNWSASGTNAAAQNYRNSSSGAAAQPPVVQPPQLLSPGQQTGSTLIETTRSGMQQVGQNLQSAGQHMGSAVDDLTGGTLTRVGEAIREPFTSTSPSGAQQNPLQTMGGVARDFVEDTRQQFSNAGQAIRNTTGQLAGSQDYRSQPTNFGTQPTDYRSQTGAGMTTPTGTNPTRYTSANDINNPQLSDPGRNPFGAGAAATNSNGPSLGTDYRNQSNAPQSPGNISQSPFDSRTSGTQQDQRFAGSGQQSDMVPVQSIDNWQYQERAPDYDGRNPFSAGPTGGYQANQGGFAAGVNGGSHQPGEAATQDPWRNTDFTRTQINNTASGNQYRSPNTGQPGNYQTAGPGGANQEQPGANGQASAKPWGPLMATGVALIGSLGANLFLGFSFLETRHKYLSAIRRGARSLSRLDAA